MEPPHSGYQMSRKVYDYLKECEIDDKTLSITLDNASTNDNLQDLLKDRLLMQNNFSLVCNGEFLHVRCCAHILNLIVQEGLKVTNSALNKMRESIRYVNTFEAMMNLLKQCVQQVGGIDTSMGL
ncbi:hypothetical protein QN277_000994 [Acacia crassicarpa]|uniref:Uncharacterized protein n=1 Tax=Acacia crassicarpa TaxID=499986 RepID=A0AAE1N7M3_9FABA|nr:hypothetical protein QN277_000994 [Acacia crassicarpa]